MVQMDPVVEKAPVVKYDSMVERNTVVGHPSDSEEQRAQQARLRSPISLSSMGSIGAILDGSRKEGGQQSTSMSPISLSSTESVIEILSESEEERRRQARFVNLNSLSSMGSIREVLDETRREETVGYIHDSNCSEPRAVNSKSTNQRVIMY